MAVLSNFPKISQRSDITADHRASENKAQNCVPTCLCAGAMYLNGIHDEGGKYTSDSWKDSSYGENYKGATAAAAYIDYAKALGIKLYPIDGEPNYLIHQAHVHIQEKHPVIITIPDPWVDINLEQFKGWSHVNVFMAEIPGGLTALDPWPGEDVSKSDASWASLLQYKQIWVMERLEEIVKIDLTTPGVGDWFEAVPGNASQWKCKTTGKIVQFGILDFYKGYGNSALCGLSWLGLPLSNEIPLTKGCAKQYFERACAIYDPYHQLDNPPGAGPVYLAHVYEDNALGVDPKVVQLQKQLAQQPQTPQAFLDDVKTMKTLLSKY